MTNDAAAEKAGSAENGDDAGVRVDHACDIHLTSRPSRSSSWRSAQTRQTARGPPTALLCHDNANLLRCHHRLERLVLGIAEHKLERMRTGRQFEPRLGLSAAKVQMVLVRWKRL